MNKKLIKLYVYLFILNLSSTVFGGIARTPPSPLVVTVSGATTDTVISGGASRDDGITFGSTFRVSDSILMNATVIADPDTIGGAGAISVVASYNGIFYMKSSNRQWLPWDGRLENILPILTFASMPTQKCITVVSGLTGLVGDFSVYVGFHDASGDIHFSPLPFVFRVID